MIRIKNKFLQVFDNGETKLLYEGPWHSYLFNNGQLVIQIVTKLIKVVDGETKLLYEGPWSNYLFDNGQLTITIGNSFYAVDFSCIEQTD